MADFRELNDSELPGLSDEKLIEYAIAARDAGAADVERRAFEVLAYGLLPFIQAEVAKKVPLNDVEDLAEDVLVGALKSLHSPGARFQGRTLAEFRGWLRRIAQFRIADYHGAKEGRPELVPFPGEHEGEEETFGRDPSRPDETGVVGPRDIVDRLLDDLDAPKRRVVELKVFEGYTAAETAEIVNQEFPELNPKMTDVNADQIASRFRKELREKLDEG